MYSKQNKSKHYECPVCHYSQKLADCYNTSLKRCKCLSCGALFVYIQNKNTINYRNKFLV